MSQNIKYWMFCKFLDFDYEEQHLLVVSNLESETSCQLEVDCETFFTIDGSMGFKLKPIIQPKRGKLLFSSARLHKLNSFEKKRVLENIWILFCRSSLLTERAKKSYKILIRKRFNYRKAKFNRSYWRYFSKKFIIIEVYENVK